MDPDRTKTQLDSSDSGDPLAELGAQELEQLRQLAAAPPRHRAEDVRIEEGTRLAEHLVVERPLGAGSMGAVFVAFDESLQRRVAIKVHLDTDPRAVARLEREARALARINHPHVLSVHEVGTFGARLFVATEYVDGRDLSQWREDRPDWRKVVEVFIAAGEGLAAAHHEGLVHRDFKPANVLIGDDGRVVVADFGLARLAGPEDGDGEASEDPRDPQLTRPGATAGTPAYMAPEQFEGKVSTRADQFSYCVALAESLWDERPFGSRLGPMMSDDDLELPNAARTTPRWLVSILRRGLSVDPEDRYASMDDLVDALRGGLGRSARTPVWILGGLATVSAAVAVSYASNGQADPSCTEADEVIGRAWSPQRREGLREAFERGQPKVGGEAWSVLESRFDTFVAAWSEQRVTSCHATHRDGTQSPRLLEQSMACFDRRRAELEGVLRALERVEGPGVAEAWRTVPTPRDLSECRDAAQLMVWAESPPRSEEVVSDIRYAETLGVLGFAEESAELLRDVSVRALEMNDDVSDAEARMVLAGALARTGHIPEAIQRLEKVYFVAREHGLTTLELNASIELANWYGSFQGDAGAARVWLKLARQSDEATPLFHAALVRAEALLLESEGNYEGAIELLEAALAQNPDADGEDRVMLLEVLGTSYDASGRLDKALAVTDEALQLARGLSGDAGSYVPYLLGNRGLILSRLGRHEEAVEAQSRAVAINTDLFGADFVDSMGPRLNLAVALSGAGRYPEALKMMPAVLEATERRWGSEHPDVALVLEVRGQAMRETGRYDAALVDFERALGIAKEALGPDHPDVAKYLDQSAQTLWDSKDMEGARDAYIASSAAWDRAGQSQTPVARDSRVSAARACARLEAWEDARAHAQKALIAGESAGPQDPRNVEASFILAQAFFETGTATEQGLAQARDAQTRASDAGMAKLSGDIEAWLREVEAR